MFNTYNKKHYLTHPWLYLVDIWYELKWALQRVWRGWDDRVIFSLDEYLCEMIPVWVRTIKRCDVGVPGCFFTDETFIDPTPEQEREAREKWHWMLDEIAAGFEAGRNVCDYNKAKEAKFDRAMDLFREHFFNLWT